MYLSLKSYQGAREPWEELGHMEVQCEWQVKGRL